MIIEEKMLYDFLDDANQHELHFSRGRQNCLLIKSAFDTETDFLYLLEGYYENDPHKTGDNAAYAGVYSHVRREYFDIPYVLRDRADENKSIEEILAEFSHAVSARIAEMVHDAPVPVTEEAERLPQLLPRLAANRYGGDHLIRSFFMQHFHKRFAADDQMIRCVNDAGIILQLGVALNFQQIIVLNGMLDDRKHVIAQRFVVIEELPA